MSTFTLDGGLLDPRRPNGLRSMLLLGAAAAVGLGTAGAGLIPARGRIAPPAGVVALVNGRPILESDFRAQIEATYAAPMERTTAAGRKAVLEEMIREELMVQKGMEMGEPWTSREVRAALLTAIEQKVISDAVTTPPGEADLAQYYLDHRADYFSYGRMTLHHLTGPPGRADAAEAAAQALRAGEAVDAVAARYRLAKAAATEGELFSVTAKLRLGDSLFAAADALKDGQATTVAAPDGVHVLAMVKNERPAPLAYADVRDRVLADDQRERQDRVEAAEVRYLKRKAAILYAPGFRP